MYVVADFRGLSLSVTTEVVYMYLTNVFLIRQLSFSDTER